MQKAGETIRNYLTFAMPTNSQEVRENQRIRHDGLLFLKGANPLQNGSVSADAHTAVKQFWASQTYFIVRLLIENLNTLHSLLPKSFSDEVKSEELTKSTLLATLTEIEQNLQKESFAQQFIKLITNDCRMELASFEPSSQEQPEINFTCGNSIDFARGQAQSGRTVVIMDAAMRNGLGQELTKKEHFKKH